MTACDKLVTNTKLHFTSNSNVIFLSRSLCAALPRHLCPARPPTSVLSPRTARLHSCTNAPCPLTEPPPYSTNSCSSFSYR